MQAPLVVGYKGEIGRFILAGLLEEMPKANDIFCVDVNNSSEDVRERIEKSDFIFLCVPLQSTQQWLDEYLLYLEGKIVVEQCSVKSFLYQDERYSALRFLSMHLLFRPSATPVKDRRCLVFSDRLSVDELEEFSEGMARALKTAFVALPESGEPSYIAHDRIMSRQQSLVHRVVQTLASRLQDAESRTYVGQKICELADRIEAGDPELYRLIQLNPYTTEEVTEFERLLNNFQV